MSLKMRVEKVEGKKRGKRGLEPGVVYLCGLKPGLEEKGELRMAYIMKGPKAGGQLSRHEDETQEEFKARVNRVVEGDE